MEETKSNMSANDNHNFNELNEQRKKQSLVCDVTIQIGEEKFPCHRVVLSSCSSYFKAMFDGNYEESELNLITIKEMDPLAFEEILESMYTGRITITQRNACRLLKACSFLGLREFEKSCISFAEKNQLVDNILEMCLYANLLKEEKLFNEITRCIAENFVDLAKTYDFSSLPSSVFQSILSQETLDRREDVVLVEIVKWLKSNSINEPFAYAENFLKVAKLTTVSCSILARLLSFSGTMAEIIDVVLEENENFNSKRTLLVTRSGQPALKTYLKASTLKGSKSSDCFISLVYTPENEKKWILVDTFMSPFSSLKTVVVGDRQYFLTHQNNSWRFWMMKDGESTTLCNPPVFGSGYELVALREIIFIYFKYLGAKITDNLISQATDQSTNLLYYNPELDKWFLSPKMKEPVKGAAFVGNDNCLYLLGGSKGSEIVEWCTQVQRWDGRCSNWECIYNGGVDNFFHFCHGAACTFKNNIYLSGSSLKVGVASWFYQYELRCNKLCKISDMIMGRSYHTLTPFENEIYAIENNSSVPFPSTEKYQLAHNPACWVEESALPKKIVSGTNVFWTSNVTATVVSNY